MGAGERGEHQVATVGVTLRHAQLVAVLDGTAHLVDVGEVDLRIHALGQHVQAQGDQADVAGALAVAEQAAFDTVGAGHVAQLGGGHAGAAVVVWVQRQDDGVAAVQVAVHPLDGVRVHVRGDHLDGGGQVQDDRVLGRRIHNLDDCVADFLGVGDLGAGEGLRGVLPAPVRVRVVLGDGFDQLGRVGGQLLDGLLVLAEHDLALQLRGGVVEVDDDVLRALAGFEGAADQVLAGLDQYLDGDVVGDHVVLDDLADEVEVGLGGGREADLDLLVAHVDQQLEHAALALWAHWVDQGLVAVAQIHGAPLRSAVDDLVGPGAIRQGDLFYFFEERLVARVRHGGVALLVPRRLVCGDLTVRGVDAGGCGDESVVGHGCGGSWERSGCSCLYFPTGNAKLRDGVPVGG